MTAPIDPEKLREAICQLRKFNNPTGWYVITAHDVSLFEDLARFVEEHLPRFKEVEVWHVEYAQGGPCIALYDTETGAHGYVRTLSGISSVSCIRVTGPHKQRVPA